MVTEPLVSIQASLVRVLVSLGLDLVSSVVLFGFAQCIGIQCFWIDPLKIVLLQLILTELCMIEAKSTCSLLHVLRAGSVHISNLALLGLARWSRPCLTMGRIVIISGLIGERLAISLHQRRLREFGSVSLLRHQPLDAWAAAFNFQDMVLAILVARIQDADVRLGGMRATQAVLHLLAQDLALSVLMPLKRC